MELNLTLPQGNFILKNSAEKEDFVIAAAGGRKPELSWFKKAVCGRKIYCADRGIEICFDAGFHGLKKLLAEEKFTAPTEV